MIEFQDDTLVAGTVLVRELISSQNYVPGVSGWAIYADGSFEFDGGVFRGTIIIRLPNGQGVVIDPTVGEIQIYPPDSLTGAVVTPARAYATLADAGTASIGFLTLESPTVDGQTAAYIRLSSESGDSSAQPQVTIGGDLISINGDDMGRGVVATWGAISDSGIINATETSVLSSTTARTFPAMRAYKAEVFGGYKCSTAAGNPLWRLRKFNGGVLGALGVLFRRTPTNAINAEEGLSLSHIFVTDVNPVTSIMTISIEGSAAYDTTMMGSNGGRFVVITDIGPSSKYGAANVLT